MLCPVICQSHVLERVGASGCTGLDERLDALLPVLNEVSFGGAMLQKRLLQEKAGKEPVVVW